MSSPTDARVVWVAGPKVALRPMAAAFLALASVLIFAPYFHEAVFGTLLSDHRAHVEFAQRGAAISDWPPHFLYQATIYLVGGMSRDYATLGWAAVGVLTACVIAKVEITYLFLAKNAPQRPGDPAAAAGGMPLELLVAGISLALLFAAPLARRWSLEGIYLGQISPGVWHNPTSLLVWPLVLVQFLAACEYLERPNARLWWTTSVAAALAVMAKPNYFLAFAPVFALFAWRAWGTSRRLAWALAALVPAGLVLVWQATSAYGAEGALLADRRVAFLPFAAWSMYARLIPVAVVCSIAYPATYALLFRGSFVRPRMLLFAWCVFGSAVVWMSIFAEVRGPDAVLDRDFNFSWGAHLSLYVLFLVTTLDALSNRDCTRAAPEADRPWRARVTWGLLAAHVGCGLLWFLRQSMGLGYY